MPEPSDDYQTNPHQSDEIRPSNLESPSGLESILFPEKAPEIHPYQTLSGYDKSISSHTENHETIHSTVKPQIINHHSSSQYRKRLEDHKKRLELPEIESAIEPESSLDAHYPNLAMHNPPEASRTSSPGVTPSIDQSLQAESDEPDVIEVNEPHRPSPYLLNMVPANKDKEPETYHQPKYHSPLKSTHTKHSSAPANPISNQPPTTNESPGNLPPKAEDALSRADALLAAAASPSKEATSKNINYIIIIVVLLIFFGLGGFFAFSLLNPSSTNPSSNSPSPTTSSAGQSSSTSPTPSNQTESAKRDSQRKDDLNEISTALSAYKKTNGNYPIGENISALDVLTESSPAYIAEIANDPKSNEESGEIIKYSYSSDGNKYTLTASLENKQDPDASDGFYILKSP